VRFHIVTGVHAVSIEADGQIGHGETLTSQQGALHEATDATVSAGLPRIRQKEWMGCDA
jgi:hypothetical protein